MAETTKSPLAAAFPNVAAINPYGLEAEDVQKITGLTDEALNNLEKRYATPNWFNVAAALAEPKLGGFGAAMGRAFGEVGKDVERQKEMALPIAQARAQLAQSQLLYSQNKKAADMIAERVQSGKPIDSSFVAKVKAMAPDTPATKSLETQVAFDQKQQELNQAAQNQELQRLKAQFDTGAITSEQYQQGLKRIESLTPFGVQTQSRPNSEISAAAPAQAEQPSTGFEQKPKAQAKEEKHVIPHSNLPETPEIPRQYAIEDSAAKEKDAREKFSILEKTAGPQSYPEAKSLLESTAKLIKADPERTNRIMGLMRQGGFLGGVQNALQSGIGFQLNGLSGNLNAPVEAFKKGSLSKEDREFYDTLASNFAKINLLSQKVNGISPNAARVGEIHLAGEANPSISNLGNTALYGIAHTIASLNNAHSLYNFTNEVNKNKNPVFSIDKASRQRLHDIMTSDAFNELSKASNEDHQIIDENYIKRMRGKNAKQ